MAGLLRAKAFSLVELMVVVAIVAVVASYGLPGYQTYTRRVPVAEALSLVKAMQDPN